MGTAFDVGRRLRPLQSPAVGASSTVMRRTTGSTATRPPKDSTSCGLVYPTSSFATTGRSARPNSARADHPGREVREQQHRAVRETEERLGSRANQIEVEVREQAHRVVAADRAHDRAHVRVLERPVQVGGACFGVAAQPRVVGERVRRLDDRQAERVFQLPPALGVARGERGGQPAREGNGRHRLGGAKGRGPLPHADECTARAPSMARDSRSASAATRRRRSRHPRRRTIGVDRWPSVYQLPAAAPLGPCHAFPPHCTRES